MMFIWIRWRNRHIYLGFRWTMRLVSRIVLRIWIGKEALWVGGEMKSSKTLGTFTLKEKVPLKGTPTLWKKISPRMILIRPHKKYWHSATRQTKTKTHSWTTNGSKWYKNQTCRQWKNLTASKWLQHFQKAVSAYSKTTLCNNRINASKSCQSNK